MDLYLTGHSVVQHDNTRSLSIPLSFVCIWPVVMFWQSKSNSFHFTRWSNQRQRRCYGLAIVISPEWTRIRSPWIAIARKPKFQQPVQHRFTTRYDVTINPCCLLRTWSPLVRSFSLLKSKRTPLIAYELLKNDPSHVTFASKPLTKHAYWGLI